MNDTGRGEREPVRQHSLEISRATPDRAAAALSRNVDRKLSANSAAVIVRIVVPCCSASIFPLATRRHVFGRSVASGMAAVLGSGHELEADQSQVFAPQRGRRLQIMDLRFVLHQDRLQALDLHNQRAYLPCRFEALECSA
jgi:hypothetical protein